MACTAAWARLAAPDPAATSVYSVAAGGAQRRPVKVAIADVKANGFAVSVRHTVAFGRRETAHEVCGILCCEFARRGLLRFVIGTPTEDARWWVLD
jgi:hypothetical protein